MTYDADIRVTGLNQTALEELLDTLNEYNYEINLIHKAQLTAGLGFRPLGAED